ncbi:MAG: ChpI protein [Leptospiraceae bacterium]|nr:ChpI protein [Leptospiraceae bacterium]MCK6381655.1 ChpI protein [Leptospiraceae bacterium]
MKTAISIPDDLFKNAEKIASKMGIPRSQLFAKALEEFIQRRSKKNITEKLNQVYDEKFQGTDINLKNLSVQAIRKSLENDSW